MNVVLIKGYCGESHLRNLMDVRLVERSHPGQSNDVFFYRVYNEMQMMLKDCNAVQPSIGNNIYTVHNVSEFYEDYCQ